MTVKGEDGAQLSNGKQEDYTQSSRTKIKFAPLVVPRHRRLQTFAVFAWTIALPFSLGCFCLLCSIPLLWPAIIAYLVWILVLDDAPIKGGRATDRVRSSRFWAWFAGFFPVSLIKVSSRAGLASPRRRRPHLHVHRVGLSLRPALKLFSKGPCILG